MNFVILEFIVTYFIPVIDVVFSIRRELAANRNFTKTPEEIEKVLMEKSRGVKVTKYFNKPHFQILEGLLRTFFKSDEFG